MMMKRKCSSYIRQIPNTTDIVFTPMNETNKEKVSIIMSEDEYAQYVEWIDNDERDIKQVLTFLSPRERQLITNNIKFHNGIEDE